MTIDSVDDPAEPTEIIVTETSGGADGEMHQQLPFALAPSELVGTGVLKEAINSIAEDVRVGLPNLPEVGCIDLLRRRTPRLRSAQQLHRSGDDTTDITAALVDLDHSYLAVHGSPGCGKTHTAARVMTRLVNADGWKIGVVAQSHSVVENLLDEVVSAGVDPLSVGRRPKKRGVRARRWQEIKNDDYLGFVAQRDGCVIGGTAWDFADPGRVVPASLDLLVIEEAAQFSLANTIAVSSAAKNLLLLGDPQQLPQVSQGQYFEPVDGSVLGWLVGDAPTLDPALGYFLAQSWRMHSAVCGPVSRYSYGGRLKSGAITDARMLVGREPGVHNLFVEHGGNSTDSVEEAERIVAEIAALISLEWADEKGPPRSGRATSWWWPRTTPKFG